MAKQLLSCDVLRIVHWERRRAENHAGAAPVSHEAEQYVRVARFGCASKNQQHLLIDCIWGERKKVGSMCSEAPRC